MEKQEYIEYLLEEVVKAEEVANQIIDELDLDFNGASNLTGVIYTMRSFLVYLIGWDGYDYNDQLIFPERPSSIEVYATERTLSDMRFYFIMKCPKIAVFWAYSTQILRAALAIQLSDKGAAISCLKYETDDYRPFSMNELTKNDIKEAAYSCMDFTCPDTNARFDFASYDDANSFYLDVELLED